MNWLHQQWKQVEQMNLLHEGKEWVYLEVKGDLQCQNRRGTCARE